MPLHAPGFTLGCELGLAARSHEHAVHHVLAVACVCVLDRCVQQAHSKGFIGDFLTELVVCGGGVALLLPKVANGDQRRARHTVQTAQSCTLLG